MTETLLLGVGNIYREDDGVGPKCVDLVSFPGVGRLTVQELVPELAETILDYERVVFVDASLQGEAAELLPLLPRDTSFPLTHRMTCEGLLALTEAIYGRAPRAFLLSIRGVSFDHGETLSAQAAENMEKARDILERFLRSGNPGGA